MSKRHQYGKDDSTKKHADLNGSNLDLEASTHKDRYNHTAIYDQDDLTEIRTVRYMSSSERYYSLFFSMSLVLKRITIRNGKALRFIADLSLTGV